MSVPLPLRPADLAVLSGGYPLPVRQTPVSRVPVTGPAVIQRTERIFVTKTEPATVAAATVPNSTG